MDLCFGSFVFLFSDAWRRRRRRRRRGKMVENEMPAAEVQRQDTHDEAKQRVLEAFLNKELEDEQEDYDLDSKHAVKSSFSEVL